MGVVSEDFRGVLISLGLERGISYFFLGYLYRKEEFGGDNVLIMKMFF